MDETRSIRGFHFFLKKVFWKTSHCRQMSHNNHRKDSPTKASQWKGLKRKGKGHWNTGRAEQKGWRFCRSVMGGSPMGNAPHSSAWRKAWSRTQGTSVGEGCHLHGEDTASLLSAERAAHLPAPGGQVRSVWSRPSSAPSPRSLQHPLHLPPLDIHEVRGWPGARPEAGRYAPLRAFLGLLPLCCWAWSLTGRETWPAQPQGLILSTERGNGGGWNIFINHHKKARPLPPLCLHLHKGRLFPMHADPYNTLPLRNTVSDHCLLGTEEIAFWKGTREGPARAQLLQVCLVLLVSLNTIGNGGQTKGPAKQSALGGLYCSSLNPNHKHLETGISLGGRKQ